MPKNYRLDILMGIDNLDEQVYGYNTKKFNKGIVSEGVINNITYANTTPASVFLKALEENKKLFYLVDYNGKSRRFVRI